MNRLKLHLHKSCKFQKNDAIFSFSKNLSYNCATDSMFFNFIWSFVYAQLQTVRIKSLKIPSI